MANLKKINVNNNVYDLGITEVATSEAKGLMSATDKAKLDAMKEASVSEAAIAAAQKAGDDAQKDATKALADAATNAAAIAVNSGNITAAKAQADKGVADAATAQAAAEAADSKAVAAQNDVDAVEGRMDTAESNITAHGTKLTELENAINNLPTDSAITDLQSKVDAINAGQNLADMVADKAALADLASRVLAEEGDIKSLVAGDKVQVLADADHNGAATVYNWTGSEFEYIGVYGQDAYTKSEIDTKLNEIETHANKVDFSVEGEVLTISVTGHTAA